MKVGDILIIVRSDNSRHEVTVDKVGRLWAQTKSGRVSTDPEHDGSHYLDYCGFGMAGRAYVSHHAADVAGWKRGVLTAIRSAVEWATPDKFSAETLEAARALFAPNHPPAPKETP